MQISIIKKDGKIICKTPYSPEFPGEAKRLGGKWDSLNSAWIFHEQDEMEVKQLCIDIYGSDGESQSEMVSIKWDCEKSDDDYITGLACYIAGRQVARVFDRDSGAKMGEGIIIRNGGFRSSGSRKHPLICIDQDTIIEIRDIPKEQALKLSVLDPGITIVDDINIDVDRLKEERLKLLKRVSEIESILKNHNGDEFDEIQVDPELIDEN